MGPVGKFLVTQIAAVAELEAGLISQRTKAALAAAKARGAVLGGWPGGPIEPVLGTEARQRRADTFAARIGPMVAEMRERGLSLRQIGADLTEKVSGLRAAESGPPRRRGLCCCGPVLCAVPNERCDKSR